MASKGRLRNFDCLRAKTVFAAFYYPLKRLIKIATDAKQAEKNYLTQVLGVSKTKTLRPRKLEKGNPKPSIWLTLGLKLVSLECHRANISIRQEMKISGHTWSVVAQLNMADHPAFTLKRRT